MVEGRNEQMVGRIQAPEDREPVRFAIAGDSGAWPNPTADGIYRELVAQVGELDPPPAFFANLGDFAGPGKVPDHEKYLMLVDGLEVPNVCVVGNHDLDNDDGWENFERIHGPVNYDFGVGHTRFFAVHSALGMEGPREEDLEHLDQRLRAADEPNRVVMMHQPAYLDGRFAPHAELGFTRLEAEFLALLREHGVGLVCCAHAVIFDQFLHDGIQWVISGGGGIGLCSHYREGCPDRSAVFHAVALAVSESGEVAGEVIQAFDRRRAFTYSFGSSAHALL
jgi:hypothetical protein